MVEPAEDLLANLSQLRNPLAGDVPVSDLIDPHVIEGQLYRPLSNGRVHCYACAHNCTISPNGRGICQVRYNLGGRLLVPWGYVAALQVDPTEKKPFYHVYPGSNTLTFGMLGCDLHCPYCQNWDTSQALRDANAGRPVAHLTPDEMVALAKQHRAACIASSYNEPLITSEWARSVFQVGKTEGFTCLYVSNGNATPEVLEYLRPFTDGYKIDLKTMDDRRYRQLGGVRDHILDGIKKVNELGFWMEIVTLIVPGFNDSEDELRDAARFLAEISLDIPWHVTAFRKEYRMQDPENTTSQTLVRAAEIGYETGLRYVYAGNRPGQVGPYENTNCPNCHRVLIKRFGFHIMDKQVSEGGICAYCGTQLAGIWA
jgi:pyruvate formate lyase activating enzyme